jgi:hypothetical protein
VRDIGHPGDRRCILRIGGLERVDPQSGLDVDAGGLAVRAKHMRILNLLQIPDAMQIDVGLKEAAIGNVTRDFVELQGPHGLVQLQEAVLAAVKRPPDQVVEAVPLSRCRRDRPAAPAGLVARKRKSDRSLAKHPCAVSPLCEKPRWHRLGSIHVSRRVKKDSWIVRIAPLAHNPACAN